ncbi:MAG TPA: glycoside hydrolase family 3 C-terminal domain-containing protein [Candidatus Sulfopaludibacter sp.]|nr:glycoside hydrolase family 3 C-terminal domain-containing protein [Candidatus Sulfopaludibacter sp.]
MKLAFKLPPYSCLLLVPALLAAKVGLARAQERPLYLDDQQPVETRVNDLLSRLTLEEKISLVHANSNFSTAGVPRLGIPELTMDDGPLGVREDVDDHFHALGQVDDFATALPGALGLAATWDTNTARAFGAVIGQEAAQRGKDIMLGPAVNIQRTPLCGRNFEYMGEDPFLTSRMAVNYIEGEQAQGVSSCIKHFAANNQEFERGSINETIDERTLREIYLPAFRAAVEEAGVLCLMSAYNQINGQYCSENPHLLKDILKNDWGFKGLVMSDWGAVHHTDLAVFNGLDIEMGTRPPYESNYLAAPFLQGLNSGKYPVSALDEMVRRHLYVMFKLNLIYDPSHPPAAPPAPTTPLSTRAHQDIAQQIAEEACVLLKNDNFLPLNANRVRTIAVIGANATARFCHDGGSANIKAPFEVTALEGISNYVAGKAEIIYAGGYYPPQGRGNRRHTAGSISVSDADRSRLIQEAVAVAKSADVVIYIGGLNRKFGFDSEGGDRKSIELPADQDKLLAQIVRANPRTVVVLIGGGAVEMDNAWLSRVPALLYAWYPGMEGGNALARVLFGDVNPSGKLPCTFPKSLADTPAAALDAYPGENGTVVYKEGLLVGYRWYDTKGVEPLFPFGYGLSYTHFAYTNLNLVQHSGATGLPLTVEFEIANTGDRAGAEIAEIYVQPVHPGVFRPVKELKGFTKVFLQPGERQPVAVTLDQNAFAYYDVGTRSWVAEKGEYKILVGCSSRDIPLTGDFHLAQTVFQPERVSSVVQQTAPTAVAANMPFP